MEGYQNEDRWINLSALPRCPYGNASRIKWSDCVGKSVPFKYDNVSGQIHIVEYDIQLSKYNRNVSLLKIYIDKMEYIKNNILNSNLTSYLDANKINWDKCMAATKNNIMVEICDLWEVKNYSCSDNEIKYVFIGSNECAQYLTRQIGVEFKPRQIQKCANGHLPHYHNFVFRYITKEEYLQYKMIEKNNIKVVDKEVIL